jgi:inner membrane protein involved in colicin E2 resistance
MIKRILAITFIYVCTAVAWLVLSSYMELRTHQQDAKLKNDVGKLWGTPHRQLAPLVYYVTRNETKVQTIRGGETISEAKVETFKHSFPLSKSDIHVRLNLDHRRRGLLWYSTYSVNYAGTYTVQNPFTDQREIFVDFVFPSPGAVYDNFRMKLNGKDVQSIQISTATLTQSLNLNPRETQTIDIAYTSHGLDEWWYDFGTDVTQIKNFSLKMKTNFDEIDFPENSISPSGKKRVDGGWELNWNYSNLLSGVTIGMAMPHKLNPGPWVAQVTRSAPVSLFLFFFLLFIFTSIRKTKLHPMNYFFVSTSFFSFHLLLAYLVDHVSIHLAFLLCSCVSIALVVSYMRLVVGKRFAFTEIAAAQFVYLVLFSYTFFFEQYTGLAVTILSILTLFVVMQVTGRFDWETLFQKNYAVQNVSTARSCPYCRGQIEGSETFRCGRCSTSHHSLCWSDHGGCAIYGCAGVG